MAHSFHFVIILLSFFPAFINAQNEELLGSSGKVSWFISNQNTVTFTVKFSSKVGWLGIGWHSVLSSDEGMLNADIVVASFDETGDVLVDDYLAETESGHSVVKDTSVGGTNDVYSWSGSQSDGETIFTFQRKLVTNDTIGDKPITNGLANIIWAFGFGWPSYHGQANRGKIKINLITGASQQNEEYLPYVHASLMIIAFVFCMSFGIFVARYLKDYHWWFPLHIIIQVLAVLLALSGFGVALSMVTEHFTSVHSWFGLAVLSLTIIAPAAGWAADLTFNPKRNKAPIWPDQFHWWTGRLTVIFAFVTIILGMRMMGFSIVFQLALGSLAIIYAVIFVFIEVYRKIYSQESSEHGSLLKDHT